MLLYKIPFVPGSSSNQALRQFASRVKLAGADGPAADGASASQSLNFGSSGATRMYSVFVIALLVLALAGCRKAAPASVRPREVPIDVVLQIPKQLDELQSGMSPRQVNATLGLSDYQILTLFSGPPHHYAHQYVLRPNCSLTVVYDETKEPFALLEARLDGNGWRKSPP